MESVQEAAVCPQVRKCRGEGSQPAGHMPTCPRAPRPAPRALLHMGSCSSTCLTLVCAEQAKAGQDAIPCLRLLRPRCTHLRGSGAQALVAPVSEGGLASYPNHTPPLTHPHHSVPTEGPPNPIPQCPPCPLMWAPHCP